jgi:hypothetical protein
MPRRPPRAPRPSVTAPTLPARAPRRRAGMPKRAASRAWQWATTPMRQAPARSLSASIERH